MKKLIAILFLTSLLSGLYLLNARADLILYPGDDAYVDEFNPTTPRPANGLRTAYSNTPPPCRNTVYSYLRFDLTSLTVDVGSETKFRVYQTLGPGVSNGLELWKTDDDWNGAEDGIGDETTLIWNNRPAAIGIEPLDAKPSGTDPAWIEFTGSTISDYINQERTSNGGDNIASFLIQWNVVFCPTVGDSHRLEDSENTRGSNNLPHIYPFTPTAITLSAFSASSHVNNPWVLVLGFGLLAVMIAIGIVLRRRSKIAA
jgi:hypothetical protein